MMAVDEYRTTVNAHLSKIPRDKNAKHFYKIIDYALEKGKRLRPILALMSAKSVSGKYKQALPVAASLEFFHNSTLIHDDIIDHAELRRGKKSVYKKWGTPLAIVCGDMMLIIAYNELLKIKDAQICREIVKKFNLSTIDVCKGQILDIEFDKKNNASIKDYKHLIENKSARLIQTSIELGAISAGCDNKKILLGLRNYGLQLGMAFQIQDDLLDVTSKDKKFGKTKGGDILQGKRTFLLISALEAASGKNIQKLKSVLRKEIQTQSEISEVVEIFYECGAVDLANKEIKKMGARAIKNLPDGIYKQELINFSKCLLERNF